MNIPFAQRTRDAVDHTFGGKKLSPRPHYELTVVELIMHRPRHMPRQSAVEPESETAAGPGSVR